MILEYMLKLLWRWIMKDIKLFLKNIKKYNKYAIRSAKAELKSEVTDS